MTNLPREQRRAEIIEAAIDLMERGGISCATVRGVADVLKSSPGQIHHHFVSADALRAEAFLEMTRRSLAESDAALASLDPLSRAIALAGGSCGGGQGELHYSLCRDAVVAARTSELLRPPIREALCAWSERIGQALVQAQGQGQLPPGVNADLLADTLVLLATGADVMRQIGVNKQGFDDAIRTQIAIHTAAAASG